MNNDEFKEYMNEEGKRVLDELIKNSAKEHFKHEFTKNNWSQLKDKTNPELALMQSEVPLDSAQYILFLQEWNRRAIVEQIKSVRFTAVVTAVASIIAALLGAWVGATLTKNQQQMPQPPPIIRSYTPPSESKDVRQTIEKTDKQQNERH